mmetsp:Transcript_18343/g.39989  ORF Transcript_18343/g.39989 Transcript_18343/m.39989 type:complete len:621 (+) Transcript_18343:214-2076(+)
MTKMAAMIGGGGGKDIADADRSRGNTQKAAVYDERALLLARSIPLFAGGSSALSVAAPCPSPRSFATRNNTCSGVNGSGYSPGYGGNEYYASSSPNRYYPQSSPSRLLCYGCGQNPAYAHTDRHHPFHSCPYRDTDETVRRTGEAIMRTIRQELVAGSGRGSGCGRGRRGRKFSSDEDGRGQAGYMRTGYNVHGAGCSEYAEYRQYNEYSEDNGYNYGQYNNNDYHQGYQDYQDPSGFMYGSYHPTAHGMGSPPVPHAHFPSGGSMMGPPFHGMVHRNHPHPAAMMSPTPMVSPTPMMSPAPTPMVSPTPMMAPHARTMTRPMVAPMAAPMAMPAVLHSPPSPHPCMMMPMPMNMASPTPHPMYDMVPSPTMNSMVSPPPCHHPMAVVAAPSPHAMTMSSPRPGSAAGAELSDQLPQQKDVPPAAAAVSPSPVGMNKPSPSAIAAGMTQFQGPGQQQQHQYQHLAQQPPAPSNQAFILNAPHSFHPFPVHTRYHTPLHPHQHGVGLQVPATMQRLQAAPPMIQAFIPVTPPNTPSSSNHAQKHLQQDDEEHTEDQRKDQAEEEDVSSITTSSSESFPSVVPDDCSVLSPIEMVDETLDGPVEQEVIAVAAANTGVQEKRI